MISTKIINSCRRATKQLRTEHAALKCNINEIEMGHLNEWKAMRWKFASLTALSVPGDGSAHCIRELQIRATVTAIWLIVDMATTG
jgi:hypothetical protein